jgi:hypothetical protein
MGKRTRLLILRFHNQAASRQEDDTLLIEQMGVNLAKVEVKNQIERGNKKNQFQQGKSEV